MPLKQWAEERGIELCYIQPGNPQQNAYVERFNRTVRYDWLNHDFFSSIEEVQGHRQVVEFVCPKDVDIFTLDILRA